MVNLETRFQEYQKNIGPELLTLLAKAIGVHESGLDTLDVGFDTCEQVIVFADRDPNGRIISLIRWFQDNTNSRIINLIRWFRDNAKRSLVADEGRPAHIMTKDVLRYIKAKITGNLLRHPHASFIAKQWLETCWTGTDGELLLDYYEDSYWEWKGDYYSRLKPDVLNSKLLAFLNNKSYLEKREVQGGTIITVRQYNSTKYELRQIRWCLKHEILDRNNAEEHTTVDAGKGAL